MSRLKDIPELARDGRNLGSVMQAVRETLQTFRGYRGDPLDEALTLREAKRRGILMSGGQSLSDFLVGPGNDAWPLEKMGDIDSTPPPTPTGLAVDAAISSIFVACDAPLYRQGHGHGRTVVYGAKWPNADPPPTFSNAVELFQFQGTFASYSTDPATRWCIWIKWQSVDGFLSTDPAGGTNGVQATTGQNVALLLEALAGEITTNQLNAILGSRLDLIDGGVTLPAPHFPLVKIAEQQSALNQQLRHELNLAHEAMLQAVLTMSETSTRVSDAGIYIDAATGEVKIYGVEQASDHLSRVDVRLNAAESGISLKASRVEMDAAIAAAVLSPADMLLFGGMSARITTAEVSIDALTGTVALKASTLDLNAATARITTAESSINSLTGEVATKVSTATFDAATGGLDSRLGTAETKLTALGDTSAITAMVMQSSRQARQDDADATALLRAILNNDAQATQQNDSLAFARQELIAHTDGAVLAEAVQRLALAAQVADNLATLTQEQTTRATAIAAEAAARETLAVRVGTTEQGLASGAAALQTEKTTRATETTALANRATALEASVNNATTGLATKASVSQVDTAKADAIATSASSIATVQAQLSVGGTTANAIADAQWAANTAQSQANTATSNAAAAQTTANAAVTASSANADSVSQVQARLDGGDFAAVKTESSASASAVTGLNAQQTVKIDLAGLISGYGLASTASTAAPSSAFGVRANQFFIAPPATASATAPTVDLYDGYCWLDTGVTPNVTRYRSGSDWVTTSPVLPFVVQATPTTVNGQPVSAGLYSSSAFFMNGTITNLMVGKLQLDDGHIANLSVAKLLAGSIAVGQYIQSTGVYAGDGTPNFRIDGDGLAVFNNATVRGTIIADGPGGDRARMFAGNFEIYKQVPNVGRVLYKALSRTETGVGQNNVSVTIPGYFKTQPRVIVSPASLQLFAAAYASQDQSITVQATSILESAAGSMVWSFLPVATLNLAANTGLTVINQISGTQSASWTSSQYTTPANATSISPTVTLASNRGNGTSLYFYRTTRWRVEYLSDTTWITTGAFTTVNLGADANTSSASTATFTFPTAGTWTFRIYFEAYDTSGATFGSASYNYATDTASRSGNLTASAFASGFGTSQSNNINYSVSYSVPAGWEATSYSTTFSYSYSLSQNGFASSSVSGSGVYHASDGSGPSGNNVVRTVGGNSLTFNAQAQGATGATGSASITLHSATMTIQRRQPIANSTTANNNFQFNSYGYSLTSAQVLATGSLNWVAIGD